MSPWAQSALVYGFLGSSLLLLARLWISGRRGNPADEHSAYYLHSPWGWGALLGLGAALAAPFALEFGGAGALFWALVGAGLGTLLSLLRSGSGQLVAPKFLPQAWRARTHQVGKSSYFLAALALSTILGALHGQQGMSLLQELVADRRIPDSILSALLFTPAAALLLLSGPALRRWQGRIVGLGLLAWLSLCILALASQPQQAITALGEIWDQGTHSMFFWQAPEGQGQAQLAAFLGSATAGFAAALWAGGICLEDEPIALQAGAPPPFRHRYFPLALSGVLSLFLTGWMMLSSQSPQLARLDDAQLRKKAPPLKEGEIPPPDAQLTAVGRPSLDLPEQAARWLPLERPHRHSFAATSIGQSVVLPKDSALELGKEYKLLFRANPRGSKVGKITPRGNGLLIPNPWRDLHAVKAIRFRSKDPVLANDGNWDLRIPVRVEILGSDAIPRGVVLVPKDPSFNLEALSKELHGPYVELGDQEIVASVRRMHSANKKLGLHNAFVAHASHPHNEYVPSLRDLVSQLGFRGPYLSGKAKTHVPWALIASQDFPGELGSQHDLVYKTPPRGLKVGRLDQEGRYVTPPWEHLRQAKYLLFRHQQDPHRDLKIRVESQLEGGRLRFHSVDPTYNDLSGLAKLDAFYGPYLLAPDYHFRVETHQGHRFPDPPGTPFEQRGQAQGSLSNSKSLVPLHPLAEPVGGSTQLYRPHPAELAANEAAGPFLPPSAINWLSRCLGSHSILLRNAGQLILLLFFFGGLLQLSTRVSSLLDQHLGQGARAAGVVLVLAAGTAGAWLPWSQVAAALTVVLAICYFARLAAWLSASWKDETL